MQSRAKDVTLLGFGVRARHWSENAILTTKGMSCGERTHFFIDMRICCCPTTLFCRSVTFTTTVVDFDKSLLVVESSLAIEGGGWYEMSGTMF